VRSDTPLFAHGIMAGFDGADLHELREPRKTKLKDHGRTEEPTPPGCSIEFELELRTCSYFVAFYSRQAAKSVSECTLADGKPRSSTRKRCKPLIQQSCPAAIYKIPLPAPQSQVLRAGDFRNFACVPDGKRVPQSVCDLLTAFYSFELISVRKSSPHLLRVAMTSKDLGSLTCPCKSLETLFIQALKRLASAVQLRPWPPYFQSLSSSSYHDLVPVGSKITELQ
jgi:hypothetical protein